MGDHAIHQIVLMCVFKVSLLSFGENIVLLPPFTLLQFIIAGISHVIGLGWEEEKIIVTQYFVAEEQSPWYPTQDVVGTVMG